MANPSVKVHDITVTVTERSAAVTDVRPQSAAEGDATVTNPAQAVDGDLTSYAELADAVSAQLDLTAFQNPLQVSDAGRDWVELSITGNWANTPDAGDDLQVDFRGASTESWTTLDNAAGGAEWDGSERTWTVTTEAGEFPESGWEVRVIYTRNAGAGTFQVMDVHATIGGDVVAPTVTEIQEDVADLTAAVFAGWWSTLEASVASAVAQFGGTAAERATILNAIRDGASASTAQAALAASEARAGAAAWDAVAKGAGIPRYTQASQS